MQDLLTNQNRALRNQPCDVMAYSEIFSVNHIVCVGFALQYECVLVQPGVLSPHA